MQIFSQIDTTVFISIYTLLGVLLGSFFNVVIVRLPTMIERAEQQYIHEALGKSLPNDLQQVYNLTSPASHCPKCKSKVQWWMNIPIVSYIVLRGKCANCHTTISMQYPIIEILSGLIAFISTYVYGQTYIAIAMSLLLWALLVLTMIDLNTKLLPDIITLPLMWLGILFNLKSQFISINASIMGAVLGYLSLWGIYHLFKIITGKEGMGYGDFKLLAALGAWLGVTMLLPIVLFASVSGAIIGIILISLNKHTLAQTIAFGPYLAMGGVLSLFYGSYFINYYLTMFR